MGTPIRVTELLKKDHRVVNRLLAEYERGDRRLKREQREIYGQLFHELEIHARVERELLYGAMKKRRPAAVTRACRRHARIDRLLKDLANREPEDRAFEEGMRALKQEVEAHIAEEEQKTFPAAEEVLTPRQLQDLSVLVAAQKAKWNEGAKE